MKTKKWKKILAFILALSILCSCIIGAVSVYAEQVNSQTSISQNNSSSNSTDNSSTNDEETTDIVGENISLYAEASEEVRNFKIQSAKRVSTGTTPFDANDDPGNDSSKDNAIVRSFDDIGYECTYSGEINGNIQAVELEFKFTLNVSKKYAEFDEDVLKSWMTDIVQEDVNGVCTLTGKTIYNSAGGGAGFQSFSETKYIPVNVKGMNQSQEVIPTFNVKLTKDTSADSWKTKVMSGTDEKAIVSAVPMYDIELVNPTKMNSIGTYDFSTGNGTASNKDAGSVYGRLLDFGVGLRMKAVDSNKGMKGFYVPETTDNLTFTIHPSISENGVPTSLQALLWDYKENTYGTTGIGGRDLTNGAGNADVYAAALPQTNSAGSPNSFTVNNGGTWTFVQNKDGSIDVTVTGASLYNQKGELFAPTLMGNGATTLSPTPSQGNLYISTAYFQMVAPLDKNDNTNKKYQLEISDSNMKAPYQDGLGNSLVSTTQSITTNDTVIRDYEIFRDGSYGLFHYIGRENQQNGFWGSNLSSNKAGMGLDAYALKGSTVQIAGAFSYAGDDKNELKAVNLLMRIDDEAMQPSASASNGLPTSSNVAGNVTLLYAAKPNGEGWTSDTEMLSSKEQDLVYFASMADLKAAYPDGVCVAVLAEVKNITNLQEVTQYQIGFNVDILSTATEGNVYQTVHTAAFYKSNKNITVNDTRLDKNSYDKLNQPNSYVRDNNQYEKAQYNNAHQIVNSSSSMASYARGASLLIVGVEAGIEKSIDANNKSFDLSTGVTFIPYRLQPILNVASGKEGDTIRRVTISDILPAQLTVSNNTKFYYGDQPITASIEKLADGTTKVSWTIENVPTGVVLPAITFNAELNFENINLQQSTHTVYNTAYIEAEGDNRVFSSQWPSHPNQSEATATLVVNKSLNLSKQALQSDAEINGEIQWRIAFTNTNSLDYTNYKMLDVMPYNGDANGSSFDGSYTITATLTAPSEIKLYSSTDKNVRGTNVSTVDETLFQELVPTQTLADKNVYELNEDVTALLLKGTLPTFERYVLDITLHPTNNNGGNVYGNSASMKADGLNELTTPISKINVRERTLSGIAWLDADQDGLIGNAEERLNGLNVTLYHTDAITGQETIAKDINNNDCITTTNANGEYSFTKLPSGTYRVVFTDHSGTPISFADYIVTDKNMGTDEAINSKSDAIKSPENILTSAEIKDITLPTLSEMQKNNITIYQKQYQNLGIYRALVNKSVTKVWDDNNNQDGIRPAEIKVQLYANGTPVGNETVLNEGNAWSHTFTDLPQFEGGTEIVYSVKEVDVPKDYTDNVETGTDGNFTLTNSHTPATVEKSVTKVWDDNNNQDGIRPTEIKVQLYADGTPVGSETVLNEDNAWSHTFTDLPQFENGKEIAYSVKEVDVPKDYTDNIEIGTDGNFTLTNSHTPATVEKSVTKVWDDNNNQDGIRPAEIKVQLYANGTPVGNETVLNEDNAWTYTFTELPQFENSKEIEYTVKEINIPNGYTNHITIDENGNIVVTNTHVSATVYPPDDSSHNNMHTANTGDASNNFIWVLMLVVSVSGMVSILFVKRNRNR